MLEQLNNDIKNAMKAKEKEKRMALRYLKSMIMENNTSKKPIAELDVAIKHNKKLKDSLSMYPENSEQHSAVVLEISFLEPYLPQQLSEDAVKQIITDIISANAGAHMGVVMKELQPKIKGQFDGKRASELVKEMLA